jgi:hypothetical protein
MANEGVSVPARDVLAMLGGHSPLSSPITAAACSKCWTSVGFSSPETAHRALCGAPALDQPGGRIVVPSEILRWLPSREARHWIRRPS